MKDLKPISSVFIVLVLIVVTLISCKKPAEGTMPADSTAIADTVPKEPTPISEPLISHIYTADPSAHIFDGKLYIYPSHDIESNVPQDDEGGHFDMKDYHVLSMDSIGGNVT